MDRTRFAGLWRKDGVGWSHCCINRTGVGVFFLAERFRAGETIAELASDYDVPAWQVEDAMRLALAASPAGEQFELRMRKLLRKHGRDFSVAKET